MSTIVMPYYFRTFSRSGTKWFVKNADVFYSERSTPIDLDDFQGLYGVSELDVIIELFRINGGKPGYYLANLKDRKYYYCGSEWEDIKVKLQELGIGAPKPHYDS
ncbi:MAG: hypothetical protein IGS49_17125 [Chlorogloeopsis fritschii C42_A2020_084]|uniref:hypothetical protein n=1 Tax=Chlorogloeopsis fritschii TaxID=1124 RepID=UPI0019DFC7DC|nr:hypothetical protein [Chlorogloeopsis fritschii]MBF2007136.1 hypothetical protein [Chlorogloeopsis fritschii C42_A2020_084]